MLLLIKRKKNLFDEFLLGAADGGRTAVRLLPTLVALMAGVSMLRASGVIDLLAEWLRPAALALGVPSEMLSLVLLRPVSGSASNALLLDIFESYGADSLVGLCASVLLGSSDTVFYIVAVYFSAVGVRRTRHTLPVALLVALVALLLSCAVCRLVFSEGGYG